MVLIKLRYPKLQFGEQFGNDSELQGTRLYSLSCVRVQLTARQRSRLPFAAELP
jgi:hypothetical protein